jgi:choline dehydrogenase-like flavoprotein
VLVLEKGRVKDSWYSRIPLLGQNYEFPWMQGVSRLTQPVKELGGRRMRLWAAEALGGTTRVNGMLWTRGVPGGYNEWADSFGLEDWRWERVEPFFKRIENATSHPDAEYCGHGGLMETHQTRWRFSSMSYYEKAAEAVGLPVHQNVNNPSGSAQGFFYLDQTIDSNSQRLSAYHAFLNDTIATERRDRLSVCTAVIAYKLEIDSKGKQVTGVHVQRARPTGQDKEYFIKARREVIICSGTVCTPQLLMLSGIGPKDHIEQSGIPLVHELPAVGQNLTDHYSVPIMHELPLRDTLNQISTLWGILWHFLLYLVFGKGILADSSTPASIFVRTSAIADKTMTVKPVTDKGTSTMDASQPGNIPDLEVMIFGINGLVDLPTKGLSLGTFFTTLVQPLSRGHIELASADPRANPRIHYRVLSDERDVAAVRKGARLTMRLADEFVASGYPHPAPLTFAPGKDLDYLDSLFDRKDAARNARGSTPVRVQPDANPAPDVPVLSTTAEPKPQDAAEIEKQQAKVAKKDWRTVTDDEIDEYVRRMCITSLHLTSSCRMSLGPETGVVDQRLRVHGISNLRIADASVFPKIPSAHTMAPTMLVAERCADFLKTDWEERKGK